MSRFVLVVLAALAGCTAGVQARFPADVQAAVAHDEMRRMETEHFIIYYPAARRAVVDRFLVRADRCARMVLDHALIKDAPKMVLVMPDAAFNNAFVMPGALGLEAVSVIPTYATLDFTTSFGLPPDPGAIACHELVHYVQFQQTDGFWGTFNKVFGAVYTPQLGYDPWFVEGIATHYEARMSPGLGRPAWPIFTGMFAAAYSGRAINSGELSAFARSSPVGNHYLVGSMFVRFLAERYGERPLWVTIANQARSFTGWFFTGTFKAGFAVSFGALFDEFGDWVARTYPARIRPEGQRVIARLGNDARYARGRDGTEAWVAEDVDAPPRLVVRAARGETLLDTAMVEVMPPRKLAVSAALLTSGLSITADGREVWLTAVDLSGVYQVTRLLRWRRGEQGLKEVAKNLGPGATIDPTGRVYYYCEVDGDRWSLAAYDVRTGAKRKLLDMRPGTFVVGAQVSPDGRRLAANVWDGTAFVVWVVDAASGDVVHRVGGAATGTPVFDGSFAGDGRLMWLGVVDGRFQAFVDGAQATDAPYAVLAAREANGTIRFLDREQWDWELAEVAVPPMPMPVPLPLPDPQPSQEPQPQLEPQPQSQLQPQSQPQPQPQSPTQPQPQPHPASAPHPPASPPPASPPPASPPPASPPPALPAPTPEPLPATHTQPTSPTEPPPQPPTPQQPTAPPGTTPTASLYPSKPLPTSPADAVVVQSDEPYSIFDHLFFPQMRSPTILVQSALPHIGLVLGGADRLELQRWSLAGYYQPGGDKPHYGASAAYINNMLAPAYILAGAGFLDWVNPVVDENDPMVIHDEEHRTRDASLMIGGTYRGALSLAIGGVYTDDYEQLETMAAVRRYVGGPAASLQWYSAETTRYTGPRRALRLEAQAAYYPYQWSTFTGDIVDVGGTVGFTVPLVFGRRHTISAFARARSLVADGETGLLQVGGDSALGVLWGRSNKMKPPAFDDRRFPPSLRFVEPLRGFEDFAITSDRVQLGEIAWSYPVIIDYGAANTWFMPASYLRQLDLELFASGAIVDDSTHHYAVGAAATLRMQLFRLPLAITYQIARRLSDDLAITQLVGFGADL